MLEFGAVVVAAASAAVAATWPLALHLQTMVENVADAPFQAWTIDWVQHALTGPDPLWNANIFAPAPRTLAYSDNLLGIAVPLLPLRWLGVNAIGQLNAALLLGLTSSAAAGYLFGRVVHGPVAGALTGAAFAYGPFARVSAAHLHATFKPGIALAAAAAWWLAERTREGRDPRPAAMLLALAIAWQTSVSFYPGAYAFVAAAIVLLVRRRDLGTRGWRAAGAGLAASALVAAILALPYLAVLRDGHRFVGSAAEIADLGVDFTSVDARVELWGPLLGTEALLPQPAFPGVVLLGLGVLGAASALRRWSLGGRAPRVALALVAVGAFLALGTAAHGWRAYSPYRLLFEFVPGVATLRATGRAWAIGLLGLGLLAWLGADRLGHWMSARTGRPSRGAVAVVAAAAVLGVLVEGHGSWDEDLRMRISPADRALAADPRPGGVLYLPALSGTGTEAVATAFVQAAHVHGTTAHHRRTPNGYSGLIPDEWVALSRRMEALPSPAALRELEAIDVRFVVVRPQVAGTPWGRLSDPARAAPLALVGRFGNDLLYELPG